MRLIGTVVMRRLQRSNPIFISQKDNDCDFFLTFGRIIIFIIAYRLSTEGMNLQGRYKEQSKKLQEYTVENTSLKSEIAELKEQLGKKRNQETISAQVDEKLKSSESTIESLRTTLAGCQKVCKELELEKRECEELIKSQGAELEELYEVGVTILTLHAKLFFPVQFIDHSISLSGASSSTLALNVISASHVENFVMMSCNRCKNLWRRKEMVFRRN